MYKQVGLHVRFLFYCEVLYSSVHFQGHPTEVFVPQSTCSAGVYCVSVGSKKKMIGKLHGKIFLCCWRIVFSVLALLIWGLFVFNVPFASPPPPPSPAPLLKGEFAEAYSHVHLGERRIRLLLICLLAGQRPPSPTGKR